MKISVSVCLGLTLLSLSAEAGLFKITNRTYGSASAYQAQIDQVFDGLETLVNAALPVADNGTFMRSMANSATLSGASNVANYGPSMNVFQIGAQAGLGIGALNPPTGGQVSLNNVSGFGAQATILAGMKLSPFGTAVGPFSLDRAWGYFGFFKYSLSQNVTSFDYMAMTLYFQYRYFEPTSLWLGTLKWNGVFVGSGLRYTAMKATFSQPVNESYSRAEPSMPGNPTITSTYNGTLNAGADISVITMPIEAVTSARILYIFNAFIGFGADLSFGAAKSIANTSGPIVMSESTGSYGTFTGTASLDLGDQGAPTLGNFRSLFGVQFDAGVASIALSTTRYLGSKESAYNVGLRIYY